MKKLLIFTNVLWLSLFVFFSCTRNGGLQINSENCQTFCYDFSKVAFEGLSAKTATMMADNYADLYDSTINGQVQYEPDSTGRRLMVRNETKSVWFSILTLKNLIYQIEQSTCKLKCDSVNVNNLGIRFYFAKYPDPKIPSQVAQINNPAFDFLKKPEFAGFYGRKTLFMVPTYTHPTLGEVDFDPKWTLQNGNAKCVPQTLSSILSKYKKSDFMVNGTAFKVMGGSPDSDPNGMMNHQPMCPPDRCPGQSF